MVRQLADEADGVAHEVPAPDELVAARRRVERGEELVRDAHIGAGEGVQQRRLAGVGVADDRDRRGGRRRAGGRAWTSRSSLDALEVAAKRRDPVARLAPVGLDLGLAGALAPDTAVDSPGAEALEVRPQPPHAREVVFELRQLDLELSLGAVRVVGDHVEDHRGTVDHRHAQLGLEVSLLARRQLVVGRATRFASESSRDRRA